jgi:hypothetical protein
MVVGASETEFIIGCSSIAEQGEGYVGKAIQWSILIRSHTSLKQRLKGISHDAKIEQLGKHILEALKSEQITETSFQPRS